MKSNFAPSRTPGSQLPRAAAGPGQNWPSPGGGGSSFSAPPTLNAPLRPSFRPAPLCHPKSPTDQGADRARSGSFGDSPIKSPSFPLGRNAFPQPGTNDPLAKQGRRLPRNLPSLSHSPTADVAPLASSGKRQGVVWRKRLDPVAKRHQSPELQQPAPETGSDVKLQLLKRKRRRRTKQRGQDKLETSVGSSLGGSRTLESSLQCSPMADEPGQQSPEPPPLRKKKLQRPQPQPQPQPAPTRPALLSPAVHSRPSPKSQAPPAVLQSQNSPIVAAASFDELSRTGMEVSLSLRRRIGGQPEFDDVMRTLMNLHSGLKKMQEVSQAADTKFHEFVQHVLTETVGASGMEDGHAMGNVPMHQAKVLERGERLAQSNVGEALDALLGRECRQKIEEFGRHLNTWRQLLKVKIEDANDCVMALQATQDAVICFRQITAFASTQAPPVEPYAIWTQVAV